MKRLILCFVSAISVFFAACSSTKTVPQTETTPKFESINLVENTSYVSSKISYPNFSASEFLKMNTAIEKFINDDYGFFKAAARKEFYEYNPPSPFYYEISSKTFYDGVLMSVLLTISTYTGGAHGNCNLKSFNFDTSKQKFVNITEVSTMGVKELSFYSRKNLKSRGFDEMVDDGTTPDINNFNTFTVSKGTVTIHFEPYQVAPYASGIVTVDLPKRY